MTDDIVRRAELANQEAQREVARRSGGRVIDADGLCLIQGIHPSWFIANVSFRTDPRVSPASTIDRVDQSFRALARRPVMMTFERPDADLDAALAAAGWAPVITLPVMVRSESLTEERPASEPLRWLDEGAAEDLEALRDILRRGFAESDEEIGVMNAILASSDAVRPPGAHAVVATSAGEPAACAAVYLTDDVAVVGWVATVPEARRRGFGRLVTGAVTNRGFEDGAAWVTLQASPMGEPLYRSMGFETVTSSRIWLAPTTAG